MALVDQPFSMVMAKSRAGLSASIYYFIQLLDGSTPIGPTDPGVGIIERTVPGITDGTACYRTIVSDFDDTWSGWMVWVETSNQQVYEQAFSPATLRNGSITADTIAANTTLPANMQAIQGSSAAALSLKAQSLAVFQGTVSDDSSPGTSHFSANTTSSPGLSTVQAFYATPPSVVVFVTGNQCKAAKVQSYSVSNGVGTFTLSTPLPQAPAAGDTFLILGIAL